MGNQRDDLGGGATGRGPASNGLQLASREDFSMPFEAGQVVAGKYEVLGLIGVGGIGFVVAATHVELGEKVALKFLRPEFLSNVEAVGRFAREARAAAQIKSEHVARVFDVGNLPDIGPFIVMEYLEGKDLGELMQEAGALPIQRAVEYVLQACEALAAAHASGVVHRDIKPENLFLNRPAQGMDGIKVLDFGISKVALTGSAFELRHPMVRTTMAMGSPTYMSPEQVRASLDIDARTDIWSLGCVLYELLTGNPAFDAPSLTQISAAILEREPPSLRLACPLATPGLEAAVKHCLAKDPRGRFQNVGELAVALYPYGSQRGQISVERCCSLLRSAGISNAQFELGGPFLLQSEDIISSGPRSFDIIPSTATVEYPVSPASPGLSPARRWSIALGALGMVGLLAAVSFSRSGGPAGPVHEAASLQPPAAATGRVAGGAVPRAAEAATATAAAPAAVEAVEAPEVVVAAAPAAEAVARRSPERLPPLPSEPAPAAKSTSNAAAAAPARRRVSAPPPPKPRPALSPKPAPTIAGEPDIGF